MIVKVELESRRCLAELDGIQPPDYMARQALLVASACTLLVASAAGAALRAPRARGTRLGGRTCMSSATESSKVAGLVHMLEASKAVPSGFLEVVKGLHGQYSSCAAMAELEPKLADEYLATYIKLAIDQVQKPYAFPPFHQSVRTPFDFYEFGKRFFAPMVDMSKSIVVGEEIIEQVIRQLAAGDNVVLFANHQIEPDPTVLSLLLDSKYPTLVPNMISVAGDRVTTDPMAAPMSMGRNLLCIFSKRHIENPPEQTEQKKLHNQRAMRVLGELLAEGGKCVWIAPSGGRDRPTADSAGKVVPAAFDPKNIDMFRLLGMQAQKASGRVTHYYPLAMYTYPITPPPDQIGGQVGEVSASGPAAMPCRAGGEAKPCTPLASTDTCGVAPALHTFPRPYCGAQARVLRRKGVGIAFGAEVDMAQADGLPKSERRETLAAAIFSEMSSHYDKLIEQLEGGA